MPVTVSRYLACAMAGACLIGLTGGFALGRSSYPPLEILVSSSETILGQPIAYPPGTPKVTAAIITMEPGQETGLHLHRTPLFAYILSGELTVNYGPEGERVFRQGNALLEAYNSDHNGRNSGTELTRILAVYMGAEGVANTEMR